MSKLSARLKSAQTMAPTQQGLQEGERLLDTLRAAAEKGDQATAKSTLSQLKVIMTSFRSLPPIGTATPTAEQERCLARSILEVAVVMSAREGDTTGFQRHMAQLKPYYMELGSQLPPAPQRMPILGLNLLFLLVENRLAEFHSELELLTDAERADRCISFPAQLEQFLMVGSYDQVLQARCSIPHEYCNFFLGSLDHTVREAIAECSETAYASLSVAAAQELLKLDGLRQLQQFIETSHPEWRIEGDRIVFQEAAGKAGKVPEIPSMRLITESLSYATELERIV
ncbi:unnamed protein product [Phaeothamnion confervicola]